MDKIKCGSLECLNRISHYHTLEDCYYCEQCALVLFSPDECLSLTSVEAVWLLVGLCKDMVSDIKDYVYDQRLEPAWKH